MNLLFSIDQKSIPILFSCVYSILENGGYSDVHVFVLHSDLDEDNQNTIRDFFSEINWEFIKVPEEMFVGFPVSKRYPEQVYYRLAAPLLLPKELDRILYLDVDTIVIHSLNELYESDFEGNWFMACTHTQPFLTKFNRMRLRIPVEKEQPYVNSGVLMMNLLSLRNSFMLEDIRNFMENNRGRLWLPTQDILTSLYGDKIKIIDALIYNISDHVMCMYNSSNKKKIDEEWVKENSVIIHYFGKNKPWRLGYEGVLGEFYYDLVVKLQERIEIYNKQLEKYEEEK